MIMDDNANVQCLSIAPGLNILEQRGLFTVRSVINHSQGEIAVLLGIDTYIAGIIVQAAKKSSKGSEQNIASTTTTMVNTIH
jgi:hypothetical protein